MKTSIKKIISIALCAVMLFALGGFASSAAKYADPVFELEVVSETSSEVKIALNLVSGKFNCADFTFVAKSGYTCKSIEASSAVGQANGLGQANVKNGKVSVACIDIYSAQGAFYTATFSKSSSADFVSGDITVEFSSCSIAEGGNTIPVFPQVNNPVTVISMNYKDSTTLSHSFNVPSGAAVKWTSSDTDVVTVDENGGVYASGTGEATVTCSVVDSNGKVLAETTWDFEVSYTVLQWIIIILLFGWIWY